jgi:SNF2 family DNA or RNA helicase
MQRGDITRAPVLIVAPTGLLANWSAEHARHLSGTGLGDCLGAFGTGLRALRTDGQALDITRIAEADWVLTTYETLRDHSSDFGAVRFAAFISDEAQKVKTPGVRMTDAVKAMEADFRIAMTGTPVENRLADLWCIIDGVRSGFLGDLHSFSRTYEATAGLESLKALKELLDKPSGAGWLPRPRLSTVRFQAVDVRPAWTVSRPGRRGSTP